MPGSCRYRPGSAFEWRQPTELFFRFANLDSSLEFLAFEPIDVQD